MKVKPLDGVSALEEFTKNNPKSVIDFWAPWCGPCKMLAKVMDAEKDEDYDDVKFGKIDIEKHPDAGSQFQVKGIPCLIAFKDGKEVGRIIGLRTGPALQKEVKKLL